jgi:hypothetical protein
MNSCSRLLLLLVVLAAATTKGVVGFAPRSFSAGARAVSRQQQHHEYAFSRHLQPRQQPSSLSMGIMEDFLSGADEEKRKKDNQKYLEGLQKRVDAINALEPTIEDLGDEELQQKTKEFQERLSKGEDLNGVLLEEAFAVVREAAW